MKFGAVLAGLPCLFRAWCDSAKRALIARTLSDKFDCKVAPTVLVSGEKAITLAEKVIIGDYARLLAWEGSISLGANSLINAGSILRCDGGAITIGSNVSIQYYTVVYGAGGVNIGSNCRISSNVLLLAVDHVFDSSQALIREQGTIGKGIVIEDDVWIGAGAVVLDGVRIGRGSIIGAGTVVSKDVAPGSVVVGAANRILRNRFV